MRISLVVPCYNEQDGIPQLAAALTGVRRALGPVYELDLVFVDDGSTDATRAALERHFGRLPNVSVLSHETNRGLGAALRTGFSQARGDWIATIDSDCTYDPSELPEMIRLMELGADVVVASPYHPLGGVRNVPGHRLFLSRNLSRLYDWVLGSRIYTYTSLFRLYRAEVVRAITFEANGFLSMVEILVGALCLGAKVVEYPTVLSLRQYGESKAAMARLVGQHLGLLSRLLGRRLLGRRWTARKRTAEIPAATGQPAMNRDEHVHHAREDTP